MLKLLKAPRALKISFSSTRHATDFYAYSAKRCTVKCESSRKDGFHISLRSEVEVYLRMASVFEKQERFEEAIAM